jgi:hypothetical protein
VRHSFFLRFAESISASCRVQDRAVCINASHRFFMGTVRDGDDTNSGIDGQRACTGTDQQIHTSIWSKWSAANSSLPSCLQTGNNTGNIPHSVATIADMSLSESKLTGKPWYSPESEQGTNAQ